MLCLAFQLFECSVALCLSPRTTNQQFIQAALLAGAPHHHHHTNLFIRPRLQVVKAALLAGAPLLHTCSHTLVRLQVVKAALLAGAVADFRAAEAALSASPAAAVPRLQVTGRRGGDLLPEVFWLKRGGGG